MNHLSFRRIIVLFFSVLLLPAVVSAEDGYRLWLRYERLSRAQQAAAGISPIRAIYTEGHSATIAIVQEELVQGLTGLLGNPIRIVHTRSAADLVIERNAAGGQLGNEGFSIQTINRGKQQTIIKANTDVGLLYGAYHFLRLLQNGEHINTLAIESVPQLKLRLLNHWDNLNRDVERGYAGISIFNWHTLPGYIDKRYKDYARANASVGINGTVLTNVNANALVLTKDYLLKVKALADLFRAYGLKVYLTARFSAPIEIGGLKTADPLQPEVQQWWKQKAGEIYALIPDFGGFLVKANSEGQPGPQDYGRTHADGANMLADAVAPYQGIVMWRAFVYSHESAEDRFKQAYTEFKPLDGKFRDNVMLQVKNGPIDFQPREPFSPLFGAMPRTPLMMEFQLTQEYLGQSTSLVYEAPLFKETLESDTYAHGKGTTVASIIDGTADKHRLSGMAGVANIGNDINWCGHPFAQANWYTLGRLSWNSSLSSEAIAKEWVRQTWSYNKQVVDTCTSMLLSSRETLVNYMTPLGLHHIMGNGHHYGPMPWGNSLPRADWNPVYYHRADSAGIGFNRTATGSKALLQYQAPVTAQWDDPARCDEKYLLWFHHISWNHRMPSGQTLWETLCARYSEGVRGVQQMQLQWNKLEPFVDKERFDQVKQLLAVQYKEAVWWKDACLLYFQQFSKQPLSPAAGTPRHTLEYYKSLQFPYAPGNR